MVPTVAETNQNQTVTLQHVRAISRYNDWVFSYFEPHLKGRILELGCGIGTYSARLRAHADRLTCLDRDPQYVAAVGDMFRDDPDVVVLAGTIGEGLDFPPGSFDVVVCLNVLEHIEDDNAALRQLRTWLAPGGVLLLQVPAHQWLFGAVDAALGHWRRYTRRQLAKILTVAGFELTLTPRYLFALAMPGWWWFGKMRKVSVVPEASVRVANAFAWLSQLIERVLPFPVGLTLVTVARVHEHAQGAK
ncbi:MAG: class I SAM-dependent methyltransferase [Thermoanaerobaculales bacterium]